jgi:hypothetical protein
MDVTRVSAALPSPAADQSQGRSGGAVCPAQARNQHGGCHSAVPHPSGHARQPRAQELGVGWVGARTGGLANQAVDSAVAGARDSGGGGTISGRTRIGAHLNGEPNIDVGCPGDLRCARPWSRC